MDGLSEVSSAPPLVQTGAVSSAARLHNNPVFARAAGKMPARATKEPRKKAGASTSGGAGGVDEGARYERLSLLAVEMQHASRERDGAESTISFDEEESDAGLRSAFRNRWTTESEAGLDRGEESEDEEDDEASDDDGDNEEGGAGQRGRRRKRRTVMSPMDDDADEEGAGSSWERSRPSREIEMMAAAAYGAARADDAASSPRAASTASGTSSKRKRDTKRDYKDLFGAKGVTCVGCALSHRIEPVETFVTNNITRMSDANLWKMAALTWKTTRMAEAEEKGVPCPPWAWKDIEMHFRYHTTHPAIGRTNMIQSLATMRHHVESRMLRVDDTGTSELDKGTADLALKIIAAESRERTALAALSAPPKGGAAGGGKGAASAAARTAED